MEEKAAATDAKESLREHKPSGLSVDEDHFRSFARWSHHSLASTDERFWTERSNINVLVEPKEAVRPEWRGASAGDPLSYRGQNQT